MRTFPLNRVAVMACALLVVVGCNRATTETPNSSARHYDARGIVRALAPDRTTIDVEHEAIPGFMPSMTMPFTVRDSQQIASLRAGDAISFRLTVTDDDSWIDQIKKINVDEVRLPAPTAMPKTRSISNDSARLRDGDMMPAFELTDQNGERITLETFRGHPFVLTFIFTRCPIPHFCPLMSKNFGELQNAIKNGSGTLAQTRLLSISFDPDFDTPQILKSYAEHEQADWKIWAFATGEKSKINNLTRAFSVYVQAEAGTISHGLATALISEDGKIARIWRGNGWSPSEVIGEIEGNKQPAK
jgi:protein SCO1/2